MNGLVRKLALFSIAMSMGVIFPANLTVGKASTEVSSQSSPDPLPDILYLPLVISEGFPPPPPPPPVRKINLPYFSGTGDITSAQFSQAAVIWFGYIRDIDNSMDVRLLYNDSEVYVYTAAYDRRVWYDATPTAQELTQWDAASVYLYDGKDRYLLIAEFRSSDSQVAYKAAYKWNGTDWEAISFNYRAISGFRGGPNDNVDDRGWVMNFHIPFASLGLGGPPSQGTSTWRIAFKMYDRDDLIGTPIGVKTFPENLDDTDLGTWAALSFGLPTYSPPSSTYGGTINIRYKVNGAIVKDMEVGGSSICGEGTDFWTEWGDKNYYRNKDGTLNSDYNVQNQSDLADRPCFSRIYINFPLDQIPSGKVIRSATMTLHQFGGSYPAGAHPSLVQVFMVAEDWDPTTITWNNAPLPLENVSQAWVGVMTSWPGWPGTPRTWDLTRATAMAYASGGPLRIALYEADSDYHSGKYFIGSNTDDWNWRARPLLTIEWGEP